MFFTGLFIGLTAGVIFGMSIMAVLSCSGKDDKE